MDTFKPDTRPFSPDFLRWAESRRHARFVVSFHSGRFCTLIYAPPLISRMNTQPVRSSFTLLPAAVLDSPDWRQDVAKLIWKSRVHVRKQYPVWPEIKTPRKA